MAPKEIDNHDPKLVLAAAMAQAIGNDCPELRLAVLHHRNTLGQRMRFKGRRWAVQIYRDRDFHIKVIKKSVQCGITEYLIIWTFEQMRNNYSVLYGMPTVDTRNDFVNNRFDPLIQYVDYYRANAGCIDNVGIKHFFRRGTVKFVGSNARASLKEYPAQKAVFDEYDECDLDVLKYGFDRMAATRELTGEPEQIIIVSNPTRPNFGIDNLFNESDKKEWMVRCPHCRQWQEIKWNRNVVRQLNDYQYELIDADWSASAGRDINVYCFKCQKPINRLSEEAEWVAEFPERRTEMSGYHISKLFTQQTTVALLWQMFFKALGNVSAMGHFYNSELGLTYAGQGDRLTDSDISRVAGEYLIGGAERNQYSYAGIDVGKLFHIEVDIIEGERRKVVGIYAVPDIESVVRILDENGVQIYCIDAKPELHLARKLIELRQGGFLVDYLNDDSASQIMRVDYEDKTVKVNRTESIDEMVAVYHNKKIVVPSNWRFIDEGNWAAQMTCSQRILDINRKRPAYVWVEEDGKPDHYFHCANYCHIACKLGGFASAPFYGTWIGGNNENSG